MDTLPNDLIIVLSKHLNASEIVLSTSKTLEVEDAEESTYDREYWPWILYDLEYHIDHYIIRGICKDNDKHNLLNYMKITSVFTLFENIGYYNSQKILSYCITHYDLGDFSKTLMINAAIVGGHFKLHEIIKSITDPWYFEHMCTRHLSRHVFENGNSEFIKLFNIQIDRNAFLGAVRGNHLDLVKQITTLYKYKIKTKDLNIIFNEYRDNFDTIKYLIDIGRITIHSNPILLKYLDKCYHSYKIIELLVKRFSTLLRNRGRTRLFIKYISCGYIESAKLLMSDYQKAILPHYIKYCLDDLQAIGRRKIINEYYTTRNY